MYNGDFSIHYKMITTISLVTICHQTKILHYYDYVPHTVHFIPMTHLFCNWKDVPFNLPHLFGFEAISEDSKELVQGWLMVGLQEMLCHLIADSTEFGGWTRCTS